MRKLMLLLIMTSLSSALWSQRPCSGPEYRQFDFWIGEWEAFGLNGQKAGESKVSLILDSCIILEEWTSASVNRGLRYAGKSFNTWNAATRQWQQTWVDNAGGSNEYLLGKSEGNKIIYRSSPFPFNKDTMAIRKLTFTNISPVKLRQHGEISKDNGFSWSTEYDLEYRRKK
ncbi:MAG: hypothetical protein ABIT05_13190 [Chitinophagaceae bacterium]